LGVCMRLIWLSYFDPRKDNEKVWWRSGDSTDTRITTPCRGRGAPRMKRPFKGQLFTGIFFSEGISYDNSNRKFIEVS
jgi:hypothetical protein